MELEQELRSVSDDVMRVLEQLARLETEKRATTPGTPHFETLAKEIERLAALMFAQSHAQQALAEQTVSVVEKAGVQLAPIESVAPARDVQTILSEWREAERRLASSAMETDEHSQAAGDVRRLRDEYHQYHQGQINGDRHAG